MIGLLCPLWLGECNILICLGPAPRLIEKPRLDFAPLNHRALVVMMHIERGERQLWAGGGSKQGQYCELAPYADSGKYEVWELTQGLLVPRDSFRMSDAIC